MSKVQGVDLNIKTSKEFIHRDLIMSDKAGGSASSLAFREDEEGSGR